MAKPYTRGKSRLADLFMDSTQPVTMFQDERCPYSLTLIEASVNDQDELTIGYNTAESYPWKGRGPWNQWVHQGYQGNAAVDSWLDEHREVEKDMREGNDFAQSVWLSARGTHTQRSEGQQAITWIEGDEAKSCPCTRRGARETQILKSLSLRSSKTDSETGTGDESDKENSEESTENEESDDEEEE